MFNFKESQPKSSLIGYQDASRGLTAEERLTTSQNKQLLAITKAYLNSWKIQLNYGNFTSVLPVIKNCIKSGLREIKESEIIGPEDDLTTAYKIGFKKRKALQEKASAEFSESNQKENQTVEALIVPREIWNRASFELKRLMFIVNPKAIEEGLKLIDQRRPIYNELLNFGRKEVELLIPDSKDTKLSPQQSLALVRNLIFGWVSTREPKVLMETEGIMENKELFLQKSQQNADVEGLVKLVGLDTVIAVPYLMDFVVQIRQDILNVPTQISDLDQVNDAFRKLNSKFLIVNPFYKLTNILEAKVGDNPTLWDDDKSKTVNLLGVNYRVPNPETLRIASLRRSVDNPARSEELLRAARLVELLNFEVKVGEVDQPEIDRLTGELNKINGQSLNLTQQLLEGKIPPEIKFSDRTLNKYIYEQLKIISDDKQVFKFAKTLREQLLNDSIELCRKYKKSGKLGPEDLNYLDYIEDIHFDLSFKLRAFVRERIKGKIRKYEYIHAKVDQLPNSLFGEINYEPDRYYDQARKMTIIDALALKSKFWIREFLFSQKSFTKEDKLAVWTTIFDWKITNLRNRLYKRTGKNHLLGFNLEEKDLNEIFPPEDFDLKKEYIQLKAQMDLISNGEFPESVKDKEAFMEYIERMGEKGISNIDEKILNKNDNHYVAEEIRKLIEKRTLYRENGSNHELEPDKKVGDKAENKDKNSSFKKEPGIRIIKMIAQLAPSEFLSNDPIGLKEIIHRETGPKTDKAIRKAAMRKLYQGFKSYLVDNGLLISDKQYNSLSMSGLAATLETGINFWSELFQTESQAIDWFNLLEKSLKISLKSKKSILKIPPYDYARDLSRQAFNVQHRIKIIKNKTNRSIESKLNQLKSLRLVKEVDAEEAK
jgi:hypothetical protein